MGGPKGEKMNIGIDIDDTISETFETLLPYSQKYTIEDLKKKSNIKMQGDLSNHFYIVYMNEWNEQEAKNFWEKYYAEILRQLNIKKFASNVIHQLRQEGHKIFLITARWDMSKDNVQEITKQWLNDHQVEYDQLFLNVENKLQLAKENNIDLFIDDSFSNCKNIADNTNAKVFIMNTKMNEALNDDKIQRVYSWPEIYNLIESKS